MSDHILNEISILQQEVESAPEKATMEHYRRLYELTREMLEIGTAQTATMIEEYETLRIMVASEARYADDLGFKLVMGRHGFHQEGSC